MRRHYVIVVSIALLLTVLSNLEPTTARTTGTTQTQTVINSSGSMTANAPTTVTTTTTPGKSMDQIPMDQQSPQMIRSLNL
jgi:hypothetical protein